MVDVDVDGVFAVEDEDGEIGVEGAELGEVGGLIGVGTSHRRRYWRR